MAVFVFVCEDGGAVEVKVAVFVVAFAFLFLVPFYLLPLLMVFDFIGDGADANIGDGYVLPPMTSI